jgi:protein-S-isoprenylcysteine O-methyltransferase Ste14
MTRFKKFISVWIALLMFGLVFPGVFYLISAWLDQLLEFPPLMPEPYHLFAMAFTLTIGLFWILWAYSFLHFVGKGSPVEAFGVALYPTRQLVTTGPYAYTRNPMIFGLMLVLLGVALTARSISGVVLVPIIALIAVAYIRKFEEPGLICRFNEEYIRYRSSVPILLPWLRA